MPKINKKNKKSKNPLFDTKIGEFEFGVEFFSIEYPCLVGFLQKMSEMLEFEI